MEEHYFDLGRPKKRVKVLLGNETLAETTQAKLLKEVYKGKTLNPAWYIPREDVKMEKLSQIDKDTHCPIKGDGVYFNHNKAENIAWSYNAPLEKSESIRDYLAFDDNLVTLVISPD